MSEEKKGKNRIFYTILGFLVIFLLVVSLLGNVILGTLLALVSFEQIETKIEKSLFEKKYLEKKGKAEILLIDFKGVISDSGNLTGEAILSKVIKQKLLQAQKDDKVKGVIFKVNSPGGAVTATDKMYKYILDFRRKTNKPVVAYFDSVAASGGYYIATAADVIISHETCLTGSIGVIMSFFQLHELFENKLGIKRVVIKSGKHKDMGSFGRKMTDEEKKIFQSVIDEIYSKFVSVVKVGRGKSKKFDPKKLDELADGRIFTGKQAYKNGLVDEVGYFSTAIEKTCKLANIKSKKYSLVQYKKRLSYFEQVFINNPLNETKVVKKLYNEYMTPHLYYMWYAK